MKTEPSGRRAGDEALVAGGSLAHLLAWRVAERPTHPLLYVEEAGPWTVGQLALAAEVLARRLGEAGVGRGSRVVLRLGNDERFAIGLIAVWLRAGAAIAMHPAAPVAEVHRVVADLGAAVIIGHPDDAGLGAVSVPMIPLERVDLAAAAAGELHVPAVDDNAEAVLLLTSGSTGAPKGVVLSHANGWSNLRATASAFGRDTGPRTLPSQPKPPNLVANPFTHAGGLVRLLFALYVGRSLVVLRKFDPLKAKAALETHGIDNLTINPTMLRMLLDAIPAGERLGAVRYVSSGTAPLPPSLREEFEARFGVPVLQAYGQTEAFGAVSVENARDVLAGRRRPNSVGRPLPGVEVRIAAPEGRPGPDAQSKKADGEILVRSPSATSGYAAAGRAPESPVDADGWLHTGDRGHLDADGYLYVTGRIRSIIICGGFNVIPEEIEATLQADPGVREAVVVPVADARLGEIPVALVEGAGTSASIMAGTKDQFVAYKRPRALFVVDQLPRLASGKVDRPAAHRLAEQLLAAEAPATGAP